MIQLLVPLPPNRFFFPTPCTSLRIKSPRCVMTTICGSTKFLVLKCGGPIRSLHFVGTFQVSSDTQPFKETTFILLTEICQLICRSFFSSLHSLLRTIGEKQIWGIHRMLSLQSAGTSIHKLVPPLAQMLWNYSKYYSRLFLNTFLETTCN